MIKSSHPNYGILGAFMALVFTISAILLTPEYNMASQFLSELGVGGLAAHIFNLGLVIAGVSFTLFFLSLRALTDETKVGFIGRILGVDSSVALIGVGVFPLTQSILHTLFAFAFFVLTGASILLLSIYFLKHSFKKILPVVGFAAIVVYIVFGFTVCSSIGPIMQKLTVLIFGVWILLLNLVILRK